MCFWAGHECFLTGHKCFLTGVYEKRRTWPVYAWQVIRQTGQGSEEELEGGGGTVQDCLRRSVRALGALRGVR